MDQLLYFAFPGSERPQGGIKMILRHVETLRELGFDAWCVIGPEYVLPTWIEHRAPILRELKFQANHVVVLPDDAHHALRRSRELGLRAVVFSQGPYVLAAKALDALDAFPPGTRPPLITISPSARAFLQRLYPDAAIDIAPCFVDERRFGPVASPQDMVTAFPKKRPYEANIIRNLYRRWHPRHAAVPWCEIDNRSEAETAAMLAGGNVHLSLARLEGLGLGSLEAMASGAVCAGFLGRGGVDYATPDNGFWVTDEDCVAAADALAQATDVARSGGPALARMRDAGRATAEQWSYARFRTALEEIWMRLAPGARIGRGPLDS